MYNRYIPQNDGTYRRNRIPDPPREPAPIVPHMPSLQEKPQSPPPEPPQCKTCVHSQGNCRPSARKPVRRESVGSFLKQLLPKNFDTEDLLIVLLLLLMAGDCQEDQNSALLTLALYLFM